MSGSSIILTTFDKVSHNGTTLVLTVVCPTAADAAAIVQGLRTNATAGVKTIECNLIKAEPAT